MLRLHPQRMDQLLHHCDDIFHQLCMFSNLGICLFQVASKWHHYYRMLPYEEDAEALGHNELLYNNQITDFIKKRAENTILTWILYENAEINTITAPRLTDAAKKYHV